MVSPVNSLLTFAVLVLSLDMGTCQVCPFGWTERPGSDTCYLISTDSTRYKFNDANTKCQSYEGQVLVMTSAQEEKWVLQQLRNITGAFSNQRSWWLGVQYKDGAYQLLNGSSLQNTFVPWGEGWPGNTNGPCVVIKNLQAVNSSCTEWFNLLCTRPKHLPLRCDVDNQWKYIDGTCFKVFNDKRSWDDAKTLCEMQEGHLAVITTFNQHAELYDVARNTVPAIKMWTGLTVQSGQAQWVDGTTPTAAVTYWSDGQPVLGQGKSMMIDSDIQRRLKSWIMEDNDALHSYACQKPKGVCEDGWLTHQSTCFKVFDTEVFWKLANNICQTIGGSLVKIASPSDQTFLQRYFPQIEAQGHNSFWIGISDNGTDDGPFQWTDGTVISNNTSHWAQDPAPTNTVGNRDCGYINTDDVDGRWEVTSDCLQLRTFICTIPVNTPVLPMPTYSAPSGQCDSGWQQTGGTCYLFSDRALNWHGASQACVGVGSTLAIIRTEQEQAFINAHMSSNTDYWFGLNDLSTPGTWAWVDGSQLSGYLHWSTGEPNGLGGREDCGALWGTRGSEMLGEWNDASCEEQHQFICQKPSTPGMSSTVPPPTTTPKVVYSQKCGANWEERPGSDYCYQFHNQLQNWADAMATCRSYGGSLVSIVNAVEQSYLGGRIQSMASSIVWIGFSDSSIEGGWTWSDGAPVAFVNWDASEPNNLNDSQDCAAMSTTNTHWFDFNCRLKMEFICKKFAGVQTTTQVPVTSPLPANQHWTCPHGYLAYNMMCYAPKSTLLTWLNAQAACRREGAELASLSSVQDNDFLFTMLPRVTCANAHTDDSECVFWAGEGECDRNPQWMHRNCKDACQQCEKVCMDEHNGAQCQYWAALDECNKNPAWMTTQCALSCGLCGDRGTGDTGSVTGWWIGLTDGGTGAFQWSDQSPVTYSNWHTTMPRAFAVPSCALINKGGGGTWVNSRCDNFAKYVCKKPMVVSDVTSMQPYKVGCPVNAMGLYGFCYTTVSSLHYSWSEAQAYCSRSLNGRLATINSIEIQAFVVPELDLKNATSYWIGLTDAVSPGTYTWSSGEKVMYTAWSSNHTGNERGKCVGMQTTRPIGLWQSLDCSATLPFVCEYPRRGYTTTPTPSTTQVITTIPPSCPDNWSSFEDICYRAFTGTNHRVSWSAGRDYCRALGGDLASVHNNTVNDFFKNTLTRSVFGTRIFWIGLTDADTENVYLWSDGSPLQFTKWSTGEPNNAGGNEDCVEYDTYTNSWNDNSCYIPRHFICSIPLGKPLVTTMTPPVTTPVPKCDGTDWLANSGYCYYISPLFGHDAIKTWFNARRFCQKNGADLASIQSEDVNSFLVNYLTKQQSTNRQYWIGLNKLGGGTWQWSDSSPLIYSPWAATEPNDGYGRQSCANMYSIYGRWNDDNCNNEYHFICKRSNGTINTNEPIPTQLIPGGCPPGFSGIGNKCFKVVTPSDGQGVNYTRARDSCRAISAKHHVDIASITSRLQQTFVMTLLERVNSSVYIGLNDRETNNHFVWQNNEEVTVTFWAPNQPGSTSSVYHYTAREDCVVIKVNEKEFGLWDDVSCGSRNDYLCQTYKDMSYRTTVGPGQGQCKAGFFPYRDSCYGVYTMPKTWEDAQATCRLDDADLVSLRDIHELAKVNFFISNKMVRSVWIGLFYLQTTKLYTWKDGWPVTLTRWGNSEPDMQSEGSCVKMSYDGLWNDTSCNDTIPFVCKQSSATPPPTTTPSPGYCKDPSWKAHGAFCYYAEPSALKSWPEANYICRRKQMQLLSLSGPDELAFVKRLVSDTTVTPTHRYGYNFQYHQQRGLGRIWLGLQRTLEGGFRWSDNSPTDYLSWSPGEPNNSNNEEDCAELLVGSGLWNDIACIGGSGGDRGFVCKTPKAMPTTTTSTTTTTTTKTTTATTTSTAPSPTTTPRAGGAATRTSYRIGLVTGQVGTNTPYDTGNTRRIVGGSNSYSNTLSGGEIAGIVIGIIGLMIIVAAAAYVLRRRLSMLNPSSNLVESATGFDNALYSKSHGQEEVALSQGGLSNSSSNGSNRLNIVNHADGGDC